MSHLATLARPASRLIAAFALLCVALPASALEASSRARLPSPAYNAVDLATLVVNGKGDGASLNVPSTGGYWINNSAPANIARLNDRVLIGKTANTWDGHQGHAGTDFTWTMGHTIYSYLVRNAQLVSTNPYSEVAALFASRTGDSASLPGQTNSTCCAISAAVLGLNDNAAVPQSMYGLYSTLARLPGTGEIVNEIDVLNADNQTFPISPYGPDPSSTSIGLAINAGGEGAPYNAASLGGVLPFPQTSSSTAALKISGNGTSFLAGIVVKSGTIAPASDGTTVAMDLPANNFVRWTFDPTAVTGGFITSSVSSATTQNGLTFSDFGAIFGNRAGDFFGQISGPAGAKNRVALTASLSGQPVSVSATGADYNVDLALSPQRGGYVAINGRMTMPIRTPASSSDACRVGETSFDGFNVYFCVGTNHWKQVVLASY